MRGMDERSGLLFSYVDLGGRVPGSHPLRAIRLIVNEALSVLTARFEALYSPFGRPSIPPEQLLRAMLLQAFYSIRSERQLMERLDFDLSFRWFVGLGIDDAVWDHSTFSKNRDRLLDGDVAAGFLCAVLERPKVKRLLSTEHFSIDGTLIEAWASMKSFKAKEPPQDDSKSNPDEYPATEGRKPKSTSTARSARTRHTPRRPIRTHGSTAKAQDRARSCASSATFSWRTAAALWSMPNSPAPPVTPSGMRRWR
jgi:transposase